MHLFFFKLPIVTRRLSGFIVLFAALLIACSLNSAAMADSIKLTNYNTSDGSVGSKVVVRSNRKIDTADAPLAESVVMIKYPAPGWIVQNEQKSVDCTLAAIDFNPVAGSKQAYLISINKMVEIHLMSNFGAKIVSICALHHNRN